MWRRVIKIPFEKKDNFCKTCIHFVKGKCGLFYNLDVKTAKEYYCHGLFKKIKSVKKQNEILRHS
jgi:hypothetical protein